MNVYIFTAARRVKFLLYQTRTRRLRLAGKDRAEGIGDGGSEDKDGEVE